MSLSKSSPAVNGSVVRSGLACILLEAKPQKLTLAVVVIVRHVRAIRPVVGRVCPIEMTLATGGNQVIRVTVRSATSTLIRTGFLGHDAYEHPQAANVIRCALVEVIQCVASWHACRTSWQLPQTSELIRDLPSLSLIALFLSKARDTAARGCRELSQRYSGSSCTGPR